MVKLAPVYTPAAVDSMAVASLAAVVDNRAEVVLVAMALPIADTQYPVVVVATVVVAETATCAFHPLLV